MQGGNVAEGLEAYAQRGEWDRDYMYMYIYIYIYIYMCVYVYIHTHTFFCFSFHVQGGNVAEGLEAYAQRGEWDRALELAQQQGGPMLVK